MRKMGSIYFFVFWRHRHLESNKPMLIITESDPSKYSIKIIKVVLYRFRKRTLKTKSIIFYNKRIFCCNSLQIWTTFILNLFKQFLSSTYLTEIFYRYDHNLRFYQLDMTTSYMIPPWIKNDLTPRWTLIWCLLFVYLSLRVSALLPRWRTDWIII